jgi:hypothetical protein
MRTLIVSAAGLTVLLAACGQVRLPGAPGPAAPAGASSGIQGTMTVDVGCPRVAPDTPCPRRPLRARLVIQPAGAAAREILAESEADGRYRVPLPPGRYTIQPRNISGAAVPTAFPLTVTVRPGTWTTLPIDFDSGVR